MARNTQIVPKYSFPHVETYINDYTLVDNVDVTDTEADNSVVEAYAITAEKGIDNTWIRKNTRSAAVATFGESNFKKYGQPYMQALHVLEQPNSSVWLMRVMPEDAQYAHAVVKAYYKADDSKTDALNRTFHVKLKAKYFDPDTTPITTESEFVSAVAKENANTAKTTDGYTPKVVFSARYVGRGKCGNDFSLRLSKNMTYEKSYGITLYNFEVLNKSQTLTKEATYIATLNTSAKYSSVTSTLVDDVISDAGIGVAPILITTNEDNIEDIYDAYVKFVTELHTDAESQYATLKTELGVTDAMLAGLEKLPADIDKTKLEKLKKLGTLVEESTTESIPELDSFDLMLGKTVAKNTKIPFLTLDTATTNDLADTTETVVDFGSATGVPLKNGTNGAFDKPRDTVNADGSHTPGTVEDEITDAFVKAFSGNIDRKIKGPNRMRVTAFFDANYPYEVKKAIANIALLRQSSFCYLDCGIVSSLSASSLDSLYTKYSIFDAYNASINLHDFITRESNTNKKYRVTISYFLASNFVNHYSNVGFQIPMVNSYAQLTGAENESMEPVIEEYDSDVMEYLNDNHINYFVCIDENVFQRGTQNTSQISATDLVEENNVLILLNLKRTIEADAREQIYNFADSSIRSSFISYEKAKFAPWVGNIVESFDMSFAVSRYEFENSILHCYVSVVFRGLTKRVIIEIDLNKRQYAAEGAPTTTTNTGISSVVTES